jgi:hypothetical protein
VALSPRFLSFGITSLANSSVLLRTRWSGGVPNWIIVTGTLKPLLA